MKVRTSGRSRSAQMFTTSSERSWQAGRSPEPSGHGSFWHTLASPSTSPSAFGAAKSLILVPRSGPNRDSPLFGMVCTNRSTLSTITNRIPTAQAYLLRGRGRSGGPAGSGWVRSRSASRSPKLCSE